MGLIQRGLRLQQEIRAQVPSGEEMVEREDDRTDGPVDELSYEPSTYARIAVIEKRVTEKIAVRKRM